MNKFRALIAEDTIMKENERQKEIEQSELEALSYLRPDTDDYFRNTGVKVRSIVMHWSTFSRLPDSTFIHPLQLEEVTDKLLEYLGGKKPYWQHGLQDMRESIKCYVADRLLQIAFEKECLVSDSVNREVANVLRLRGVTGNLARLVRIAHQDFGDLVTIDDFGALVLRTDSGDVGITIRDVDFDLLPLSVKQYLKLKFLDAKLKDLNKEVNDADPFLF